MVLDQFTSSLGDEFGPIAETQLAEFGFKRFV
jgi:hypothetical protein